MNGLWQHNPTVKERRHFGLLVGAALLALGTVSFWRHPEHASHTYLWAVGALLLGAGLLTPKLLKLPYQLWMAFAYVLGTVMTNVILTVTFFVAFTLVGVIMRLTKRDPLEIAWSPGTHRSYWREREVIDIHNRHLRPF